MLVRVRAAERAGDLDRVGERLVDRQPAEPPDAVLERLALDVLEDDVGPVLVLAGVDHADDVRVRELRDRARLAPEALQLVGVGRHLAVQQLDRHPPLEVDVEGPIDRRHPSGADLGVEPVPAAQLHAHERAHGRRFVLWPICELARVTIFTDPYSPFGRARPSGARVLRVALYGFDGAARPGPPLRAVACSGGVDRLGRSPAADRGAGSIASSICACSGLMPARSARRPRRARPRPAPAPSDSPSPASASGRSSSVASSPGSAAARSRRPGRRCWRPRRRRRPPRRPRRSAGSSKAGGRGHGGRGVRDRAARRRSWRPAAACRRRRRRRGLVASGRAAARRTLSRLSSSAAAAAAATAADQQRLAAGGAACAASRRAVERRDDHGRRRARRRRSAALRAVLASFMPKTVPLNVQRRPSGRRRQPRSAVADYATFGVG